MENPFGLYTKDPGILGLMIMLVTGSLTLSAQDTEAVIKRNSLNIPFRKYGLSIGNSVIFNGIRINFIDKDVQQINGLNLAGWTKDNGVNEVVNGFNIGIIPNSRLSRAITIGLYGAGGDKINGFVYGTVAVGSKTINGISIAGLINASAGDLTGISLAGIGIFTHKTINGIAISVPFINAEENINGVAIDAGYIQSKKIFRGLAITTGYLNASKYRGVSFSSYSRFGCMSGLSFALFNHTSELHGLQVGLLNYAGNNPKALRLLPVINLHLGKEKKL